MLQQKRIEFKLIIKKSTMMNYLLNNMSFDSNNSLVAQAKYYRDVTIESYRVLNENHYDKNFEEMDKLYT